MKITRRDNPGGSGTFQVSVPASRIEETEAALSFLEEARQIAASQVVIDLIVTAARRRGWKPRSGRKNDDPQFPALRYKKGEAVRVVTGVDTGRIGEIVDVFPTHDKPYVVKMHEGSYIHHTEDSLAPVLGDA